MRLYLITGISGYVGSMLAAYIIPVGDGHSHDKKADKRVIGICRDINKAKFRLEGLADTERMSLISCDLTENEAETVISNELGKVPEGAEIFIIHCASVTTSKTMVENPVSVADGIVLSTRMLLDIAVRYKIRSFVYLSSMEVYGTVSDTGRGRKEYELGDVDLESSRNCYPMAKRMAEHYCHLFYNQFNVPVKIARLAQTFGLNADKNDARVFMQFTRSALEGRDMVLKTDGLSVGNYVAIDDAVNAILTILHNGKDGECYNVVNESNTMTIREMAELVVSKIAGGTIRVVFDVEDTKKTGYAPKTALRMSSDKLRELGWKPTKDLNHMYMDAYNSIKS